MSCTTAHRQEASPYKHVDIEQLLAKPSWSVASLLPSVDQANDSPQVSSQQLHHLLRLSALPPPKDAEEEAKMLSTLSSQLHFVREIQKVDTTGVKPLQSLRDETEEGEKELEIGMDELQDALAQEEVRGKHHKRIRRKRNDAPEKQGPGWDVLGVAEKRIGKMFVVEGGKD